MGKQKQKSKSGRPKGAKNREYSQASVEIPAECLKCGSADLRTTGQHVRRIEFPNMKLNGIPYKRKEIRRCVCQSCGQHCMKSTYFGLEKNAPGDKDSGSGSGVSSI